MTKKNINKLVAYWMTSSEMDFSSAEEIAEKTSQYVNVLFLLHLSIEKILKAYYVHKFQDDAPFTHNLIHLASKTELDVKDKKTLAEMNEFNLRCRYPDDKFQIYKKSNKKMVLKMLKFTKEFREWMMLKLKENV
jgi:HEPN domain-containing protein